MLAWIIVPAFAVVAAFYSISVYERGNIIVASASAGLGLFASSLIMMVAGAAATGLSSEETVEEWDISNVRSYVVDGTTVYSYDSNGKIWEFFLSTNGNMIAETTGDPYLRKTCGVTPEWVFPFNMGECSKTLFIND